MLVWFAVASFAGRWFNMLVGSFSVRCLCGSLLLLLLGIGSLLLLFAGHGKKFCNALVRCSAGRGKKKICGWLLLLFAGRGSVKGKREILQQARRGLSRENKKRGILNR